MAKIKTVWVCSNCGNETAKWYGKCSSCNSWNTLFEEKAITNSATYNKYERNQEKSKVILLNDAPNGEYSRESTGFLELDRVLGGGIVKGSLILLGGEPGIGKSTLILELANNLAKKKQKVLYISGEESAEQIKLRADRLNVKEDIYFYGETNILNIENVLSENKPDLCIIDSIQTMFSPDISSAPGSVSQVREITAQILKMTKEKKITTIIIGHVTKDGSIAGPRVLEHMVDAVIYIEGERYFSYRIVRGVKNRFGSTNEIGIFEMTQEGLVEVLDPSSILIEKKENVEGSIIASALEGTRPMLVEIQSLSNETFFPIPKRATNGIDNNRLNMILAVLEKYIKLKLGNKDIYTNLAGGMKILEPSLDLAIAISIVSSYVSRPVDKSIVLVGEIGLSSEIRSVNMVEKRIQEANKLGYTKILIPYSNYAKLLKTGDIKKYNIKIVGVNNLIEAIRECNLTKNTKKGE